LGSFYWADKIEETGALCFIIKPYKFRIIKDSWNKTDKQDSRNMAKALWAHVVTGEFGLPVVHKPSRELRELRRLFSVYESLNKHLVMLKNNVQSILTENGIVLAKEEKKLLLSEKTGLSCLEKLDISEASTISICVSLEILWKVQEQKEQLAKKIFYAGKPFEKEVKLLISIKGITPLSALAFLSDVGDVRRFKTTRKMNAYLGLVPKLKESGDTSRAGHINRASRKTTRTLLTQSLVQAMFASPSLNSYYENVKYRRGAGRASIALIRELCGVMRRMLLTGEQFKDVDFELYNKKVRKFDRTIKIMEQEKKIA
jgi:transposase